MSIAALILATIALLISCGSLIIQLSKQFSTHTIQYEPLKSDIKSDEELEEALHREADEDDVEDLDW